MHEMQTIVIDVRDVCLSVYLSVCLSRMHRMTPARLHCAGLSAAARAVNTACPVRGVIRCSLRQMPLAFCFLVALVTTPYHTTARPACRHHQ